MTIGELREAIAGIPDDTIVVMSRDAEGNGYSPLYEADDDALYSADTTWSGSAYKSHEWILANADAGFGEDDEAPEGSVPCVVLWPVN